MEASRYAAAEKLLPHRWSSLILSGRATPNFIDGSDRFWFADKTSDGLEFVTVDPEIPSRRSAFDHARLASALGPLLGREVSATDLPFGSITFAGNAVIFTIDNSEYSCELASYACDVLPWPAVAADELLSPDRMHVAFERQDNLWIRERATGTERQLSFDGEPGWSYATPPDVSRGDANNIVRGLRHPVVAKWSPDSRRIITHRLDQRDLEFMHLTQASPPDGSRPKLLSYRYAMVGEAPLPMASLVTFEVATGEAVWARCDPFIVAYISPLTSPQLWWVDGERVQWVSGDRADRTVAVRELEVATGVVRPTPIVESGVGVSAMDVAGVARAQLGPGIYDRVNVKTLDATGEAVTWSERSGWGHLYLIAADGTFSAITDGEWTVRELLHVDERARTVLFTAGGREPDTDPYPRKLYRASIDAGAIDPLDDDDLDHAITVSPSGRYLIDVASSISRPGVASVRSAAADAKVILELCSADASRLSQLGYQPPERFRVIAADGVSELWGLLYQPAGLDVSGSYPVLDLNYPGPQQGAGSVRYPGSDGRATSDGAASAAALGFAVVVVEGRGTPLRGRAFQDATRIEEMANFDDHETAIRQLATSRPWLDLTRVGVAGHSGGGYFAAKALVVKPDFYAVGVSTAGDHDDRFYHGTWGEFYWGTPDIFDYVGHSAIAHAGNLRGKLLLIHGELDDNVTPHLTMRLVDAFMAADVDVDLMIVPNADHAIQVHQAHWTRRRWDYLVTHLMGERPPEYRLAEIPYAG